MKLDIDKIVFNEEIDGQNIIFEIDYEKAEYLYHSAKVNHDEEVKIPVILNNGKTEELDMSVEELEALLEGVKEQYKNTLNAAEKETAIPKKLDEYLIDLTDAVLEAEDEKLIGREHEIEKAWFYLSQATRNNVFLIGESDVGKTSIALEMIRRISQGECPKDFDGMRVIQLNVHALLELEDLEDNEHVKSKSGKFLKVLNKIKKFFDQNKFNTILYIDEAIYTLYSYNVAEMLFNLIKVFNVPILTTCLDDEFFRYFLDNPRISKFLNYIEVTEPKLYELKNILKYHVKHCEKIYEVKMPEKIVKFAIYTSCLAETPSVEPGRTANIIERACMEACRKGKKKVDKKCVLSCYNTYLKLYENTSEEEKLRIAYHETGHYIVSKMSKSLTDIENACVSILPMMDWLGVTWTYAIEGKKLNYTRKEYIDSVAVDLAGRAAEYKLTKSDSDGASSDLNNAANLAELMILRLGLSENAGLKNRSYVSNYGYVKDYMITDNQRDLFNDEVQKILEEANEIANEIINKYWPLIEMIVKELMKEEILTGEELDRICKDYLVEEKTKSDKM